MLRRLTLAAAACVWAAVLPAQTTIPSSPEGIAHLTENTHAVTGVRIRIGPDGSPWFLIPSNDRIVRMQGDTFTQWQVRDDKNLGLNPVDFELDGNLVWFIGNGESQIDPGRSVFARLDTDTGALREWVMPGSKPAGFWRAPDGKVWLPQTDGRLQSLDPVSLQVVDYRSRSNDGTIFTFAYADVVPDPDGSLWMADFGNNRIVHYVPGADSETSWTLYDPNTARLNLSQIRRDADGRIWVSQLSGLAVSYLDPSANLLINYTGFSSPIHFDLHQGRVYVAEAPSVNGGVAVLDPQLAFPGTLVISPQTVPVHNIVNGLPALIRDSVITPTTYASPTSVVGGGDITVTAGPDLSGIQRYTFSSGRGFGILLADGYVWVGSDDRIDRLNLEAFGADTDLCVPVVFEGAAADPTKTDQDRVDVMLANMGGSTITGNLNFLYSPAAAAASLPFTVGPNGTNVQTDVFASVLGPGFVVHGPVRIQVTGGNPDDLVASARSAHSRAADSALYGFTLPAASTSGSLGAGDNVALFTSGRDTDVTTLGLYSSSQGAGAQAMATLFGADGTARGTRSFNLPNNALLEFTPAASAFGVDPRPGDVVQITAGPGSLRAYVRVTDQGSNAIGAGLPVHLTWNAVAPYAANGLGADGTGPVTDLYLWNPDTGNPAAVTVSLLGSGAGTSGGILDLSAQSEPRTRGARPGSVVVGPRTTPPGQLTLPPGGSLVVADALQTLFGISAGSGALKIVADRDIASAVRVASRKPEGDYATFLGSINGGTQSIPPGASAFASGLQEIPGVRSTDLLLSNGGGPTSVTVVGYDGNGSQINTLSVNLAAGQSARIPAVLHALGLDGPGQIPNARVRVDAASDALVYAAFVQTDAVTGDPELLLPR
jgi:sugar lactone lactonase YvrE